MFVIVGYLFSIIWELLWFWYDHPFICVIVGGLGYMIKDIINPGDLGQLDYGSKKSKPVKEEQKEPQVVIVGGGAAGLSIGGGLKKEKVSFIIIDGGESIGESWKNRYDRLHLHTTRNISGLPYVPFPKHLPVYPAREDVVNYLEGYATMMGLTEHILLRHVVKSTQYDEKEKKWTVVAESREGKHVVFHPKQLVVASGENTNPKIPQFDGASDFKGQMFHSSSYRNGEQFRDQKVLVVGFGNSGCEIALDLWEHNVKPTIMIRSPYNVTIRRDSYAAHEYFIHIMRFFPLWMLDSLMRFIIQQKSGDLKVYGIVSPHPTDGVITNIWNKHKPPVMDVGTLDMIRKGEIKVVNSEIEKISERSVRFKNGTEQEFDAIILATGYQFTSSFSKFLDESIIKKILTPYHVIDSGKETPQENLYFIGFNDFLGRFHEISREGKIIAKHIPPPKKENFFRFLKFY